MAMWLLAYLEKCDYRHGNTCWRTSCRMMAWEHDRGRYTMLVGAAPSLTGAPRTIKSGGVLYNRRVQVAPKVLDYRSFSSTQSCPFHNPRMAE